MQQRARGSYHGIYENHICELRIEEELYEGRSSQLYTQLLHKSSLYGIRTLDLCDTDAALYQF